MDLIQRFLQDRSLALFFSVAWGLASVFLARALVMALYELHHSRSALKKLAKEYSLWDRVLLKHAWENCLHARHFCRKLILFYHVRLGLLLLSPMLQFTSIFGWLMLAVLVGLDVPMALIHFLLEKSPLQKRHRGYRFEQYKNTGEREKLF